MENQAGTYNNTSLQETCGALAKLYKESEEPAEENFDNSGSDYEAKANMIGQASANVPRSSTGEQPDTMQISLSPAEKSEGMSQDWKLNSVQVHGNINMQQAEQHGNFNIPQFAMENGNNQLNESFIFKQENGTVLQLGRLTPYSQLQQSKSKTQTVNQTDSKRSRKHKAEEEPKVRLVKKNMLAHVPMPADYKVGGTTNCDRRRLQKRLQKVQPPT